MHNSFGKLNQQEKNNKMWRFLSGCKLPSMEKKVCKAYLCGLRFTFIPFGWKATLFPPWKLFTLTPMEKSKAEKSPWVKKTKKPA